MLRENNARKGFFESEQFKAVLEHLPDYLKSLFEVAYITGWRVSSELLTRKWQHVDLEKGWLRLDPGERKNAEGRMFPLTPQLDEIFSRQLEKTKQLQLATDRVIPGSSTVTASLSKTTTVPGTRRAALPGMETV
jgi:integrase